nr:MAG TPA: hypothetical protein [Caudoviricetes sp.]
MRACSVFIHIYCTSRIKCGVRLFGVRLFDSAKSYSDRRW